MGPDSPASEEIRRFEEQYRRQPESLVFARLADAYRKAGNPEKALEVLADGLARHPDYPSGHIVRARALNDLGRLDETLQSFRRALELDGANLVAIRELAGLAEERGDSGEARHWYERLAQIDPADEEVRRKLADLESARLEAEATESEGPDPEPADSPPGMVEEPVWWDDSAVDLALERGDAEEHPEYGSISWGETGSAETRSEEDVVEAILNGDVPETVRAEDTWWYEEARDTDEPLPSRDADVLTRTMADLYAEQGLLREAVGIYEELIKDAPDDAQLLERLAALRQAMDPGSRPLSEPAETSVAEAVAGEGDRDPDAAQGPDPLGRPIGTPWLVELRRLLRTGEERAADLVPREVAEPVTQPAAAAHGGAATEVADSGADHPGPRAGDSMSRFAREWIQGLGTDA